MTSFINMTRKDIHALTHAQMLELGYSNHEIMELMALPYPEKFKTLRKRVLLAGAEQCREAASWELDVFRATALALLARNMRSRAG
jgi:hypothetical protein